MGPQECHKLHCKPRSCSETHSTFVQGTVHRRSPECGSKRCCQGEGSCHSGFRFSLGHHTRSASWGRREEFDSQSSFASLIIHVMRCSCIHVWWICFFVCEIRFRLD